MAISFRGDRHGYQWHVVQQLRAFYVRHGRVPTWGELGVGGPCKGSLAKRADLPWGTSVHRSFGSLEAAFLAAGLPRRRAA